jgi:hypothetical protein
MSVAWPSIPHWPDEPASEAFGFVLPGADIDLAGVAEVLRRTGSGRRKGSEVSVAEYRSSTWVDVVAAFAKGWMVRVYLKDGILSDARDMAGDCFRDHPRAADIATCDRLVDIMVADPGGHRAAFDCLDAAREWLKEQPGVIALDPGTGEPL